MLDWRASQPVQYAVPAWLRDQQIAYAIQRVKGRVQAHPEARPEPVAVVGYGPSLAETWEEIRGFRYVISCSGAHKYLGERGIIPTWHVEVDPRPHKVVLIGEPQRDTTYLIASTCHKAVFDHLDGYDVKLWHVFNSTEEGQRLLPPDEWALTGGCDVGLRSLTMAAFLGFRDVHLFGLDGCAKNGARHAGSHPNGRHQYQPCEYGGVVYDTTPAMLEAARAMLHELDAMPKVTATFHGEGMIQHMVRDHQRPETVPASANIVAFQKPALISTEYKQLNIRLHEDCPEYGVSGARHAPLVRRIAEKLNLRSVLDYGCGKGQLAAAVDFPIWEYDPAIPGKDVSPRPADFVVCTDVLEHVEPERLDFVLDDLRRVTRTLAYLVVHRGPARKVLWDGRNAHLIQRDAAWWTEQVGRFFHVSKTWERGPELHLFVTPKPTAKAKAA